MAASRDSVVELGEQSLALYQRFSLYNSPYAAHDAGCAIDCYPAGSDPHRGLAEHAPSPVGGVVRETKTVQAPPKSYAPPEDYLVLLDVDEPHHLSGLVARILHVDPAVEPGDRIEIGDSLGTLVRAGFFAPWVGTHLHVGFRTPDQNQYRATGSLPIDLAVDVEPVTWDGTGTVVATGETYAILDAPSHPNPGSWAGIATDDDDVLDGGLPHYEYGGVLDGTGTDADEPTRTRPVALWERHLGDSTGRTVRWDDLTVLANGEPVTGLSFCCARDDAFGAKLVHPDHEFTVGQAVTVSIEPDA